MLHSRISFGRLSTLILQKSKLVRTSDCARHAWAGLQRFHDVDFVERELIQLHEISAKQRSNAKKQAVQIRHCLAQAREYFRAAEAVTLAVKPVLLYYSVMSLALAEILLKQTGDSSLDRAREHHRHHGLDFQIDGTIRGDENLAESCIRLRGAPLIRKTGEHFGTFALWHRSCRESPIAGKQTVLSSVRGVTQSSWRALLLPADEPLESLPQAGLSLLDCFCHLPHMKEFVASHQVLHRTVRARVEEVIREQDGRHSISLTVHPGNGTILNEFYENFLAEPRAIDSLEITELPSGVLIQINKFENHPGSIVAIPSGTVWDSDEVDFWPVDQPLNEFGFFYVALFIVGNLARYYPDIWLREISRSTPLVLGVEELLRGVEDRMLLSSLSEMQRTLLVPE